MRLHPFAIVAALACSHAVRTIPTIARPLVITQRACYSLVYTEPVGNASELHFPNLVELMPGRDSADALAVVPAELQYQWWKRMPADSMEINLSGAFTAMIFHVARAGQNLVGHVTFYSDIIDGRPLPSMHVQGTPTTCPSHARP